MSYHSSNPTTVNTSQLFDVFLCHNSIDKTIVRLIAQALEERNVRVWLDEEQLIPGRPWVDALEEICLITRAAAIMVGKDSLWTLAKGGNTHMFK